MTSEEVYEILCKIIADYAYNRIVNVDEQGFVWWKDEIETI